MKILIVKLNAIGDVLFATPLAGACRQLWPDAAIDWLVAEHAAPVLRAHPLLRQRIIYRGPWGGNGLASLIAYRQLLLRLRAEAYDIAFYLHRNFAGRTLVGATHAVRRVGFDIGRTRPMLTDTAPFDAGAHETERYLALLRALGHEVTNPGMSIGLTDEAQVTAELLLAERELPRPLIGLAPGGGRNPGTEMLIKRWPAERYGELARAIRRTTGAGVVIVGSRDETELCARVAAHTGEGSLNLCGRTDVAQLAAVLARCRVVVANDSGPLHIAAAAGCRTVALFGPTDPRLVAPLGDKHRFFWRPPECGPCYRPDNARNRSQVTCQRAGDELRCLRDIGVDEVLEAVVDALANKPWPRHESYRREPV